MLKYYNVLNFIFITDNTAKIINVLITILKLRLIPQPSVKNFTPFLLLFFLGFTLNAQIEIYTNKSVLSDGEIFKISVAQEGIYKLDFNFLKDQVGIENIASIDPKQIKIYSNGGGALPHAVSAVQIDDLQEVTTFRSGLSDGSFQNGDFILLYAEGPSIWKFDNDNYTYHKNTYDDFNYYFIKISTDQFTPITSNPSIPGSYQSSRFNDLQVLNEDKLNLLGKYQSPGSGSIWLGDEFINNVTSKAYTNSFQLDNLALQDTLTFNVRMALRASSTTAFNFTIAEKKISKNASGTDVTDFEDDYAHFATIKNTWIQSSQNPSIEINLPSTNPSGTRGWLDYIEINARKNLIYNNQPLVFRDVHSKGKSSTTYTITNSINSLTLLNISNPIQPFNQEYSINGNTLTFGDQNNEDVHTFILFDSKGDFTKPSFVEKIANQNLHALSDIDMVILYHPDFQTAAEELAMHRSTHSGLSIATVNVKEVYNEFGGGSGDVTAIRDMMHMLHTRSSNFKYLLLMGDATYDYRHRNKGNNDDNFIPVYETIESFHPIFAYPTDDYYGLLDSGEGDEIATGDLDISVGRIPCRTASEASGVVNKIINYDNNPATLGNWRNRLLFLADDEDSSIHLDQVDFIAKFTHQDYPIYNQEKIYIDAYQQISTPGGERYPDVTEAINNNVFKGILVFNYLGHGGQEGLAQERILRAKNLSDWENIQHLPLFITATCSFTGFDEPIYNTAGEQSIMNPNGGVIALMTTVRAVYSGDNATLTNAVFRNLFKKENGKHLKIGEIMQISKNQVTVGGGSFITKNARKFQVIGDPSMTLAYPEYEVVTTEMNGIPVAKETIIDTISALDQVVIKGRIEDNGLHLTNFNGQLNVIVFDKVVEAQTLQNDSGSKLRKFDVQNRIIFKGNASVKNGSFEVTFVVPKDINFNIGQGKISYYASDLVSVDASGMYDGFAVGGASNSSIVDDNGPDIQLFMNDESFKNGGTTGVSPVLIVKLKDDFGINVAGTSIGHDLEAVIDGNSQNSFILNDFYEAAVDDFTSGEAQFRFFDLEKGPHSVTVTAWDIANNFAESSLDFIVSENAVIVIKDLLNYPNPVTENTFFKFNHNKTGAQVDVEINIFDVAGHRIANLDFSNVISDGNSIDNLQWDGKNNSGSAIGQGIYFYAVKMTTRGNSGEEIGQSTFEKMIIIK